MTKRTWLVIALVLGGIAVVIAAVITAVLGWLDIAKILGAIGGAIIVGPPVVHSVIQLASKLRRAIKGPIRVDIWYVSLPTQGVVLEDFDPNKDPRYYCQYEGQIAYWRERS